MVPRSPNATAIAPTRASVPQGSGKTIFEGMVTPSNVVDTSGLSSASFRVRLHPLRGIAQASRAILTADIGP